MGSLDIRTIIFSFVLTNIVSTLVVIFLWKQYHKRYNGISYWIYAFAFQTLAYILIGLRGTIPIWISIDLANAISVLGIFLGYVGLETYTGRKSSQIPNLILLFVFAAAHTWFTYVNDNLTIRYLLISAASLSFFLQCAWLMLYRVSGKMRLFTNATGLVFLAFCIVCIAKMVEFFIGAGKPVDYFQSDMFEAITMIIYQMLLIVLTYSFALMFSKHLLSDIRLEEEKFSKAFHTSTNAILLTSFPDGQIIEANKGFLDTCGYQYSEISGKTTSEIKIWDSDEDRKSIIEELSASEKVHEKEFRFRKKSGEKIIGLLSAEVIKVSNEKYLLSTISNITERKHTEEELIKSKENAEESDRLKTAFLHNISHEIRTPLNAIVGFSTLLGEPGHTDESRQSLIEIIRNSSDNLLAIVTDIIEVSNIEAGVLKSKISEINLNALMNNLYKQFRTKADEKGIKFRYKTAFPDLNADIQTDSTKLIQILLNIIGNAFKFTSKGLIEFGYDLKEDYLEFYISDSGIGIPEEQHTKIFDRFYQVDDTITRQFEGTGLGLPISKAFIEFLGGKIWLTSEAGKGSVFYFTLPYVPCKPSDVNLKIKSKNEKVTGYSKKSILIAEDDDNNYFLMSEFLSSLNVNLIRACNGKEAIEICESGKDIDLVLMDIKMPVIDGYTAFNQIRKTMPSLPVIATTAYAFVSDKEKILRIGFCDYVVKPFSKTLLLEIVRKNLKCEDKSISVEEVDVK